MPEVDVTYADVKFKTPRSRGDVAAEDVTYSEVKISNKQQSVCSNCSANIQQSGSSRRSKVTPGCLVLLALVVLLAAALIALGVTFIQTSQTPQTLKEDQETLRKNLSDIKPGSTTSAPSCPPPPSYPPPPSCPPPPAVKKETFQTCEEDWEKDGGNCYYFNTMRSSWINSRSFCVDRGSDLVKIDSREEQMFLESTVRGLMKEDEEKFWIGLTDSVEEGKWFWVDGSPLDESLSFWIQNEPDDWKGQNPAGEDCVRMGEKGGTDDLKCWFDHSCNNTNSFICEKPAAPVHPCV